jgi:hypothetical protein
MKINNSNNRLYRFDAGTQEFHFDGIWLEHDRAPLGGALTFSNKICYSMKGSFCIKIQIFHHTYHLITQH